ncbi:hypothetical protein [Thiomonas bhubaneswarensis]|uniref:Uncharacterized protein n=1 Tax=Thiomonas bhubaneswarensis TaxID=339866 RepID=A0A0K6HRP1_9BURK|nr:hypothetical protein [Thiomonas bhubaneswarensis]CUA93702.1 hypothetical protein Ga0061069_101327 [Thiomonas bhubaneswarensis]
MPISVTELRHVKPAGLAVAVLGAGDVGSAVAHALFGHGIPVLLVESAQPTAPRRGMCWVDAVFDGSAKLLGVRAVRVFQPHEAMGAFVHRRWIALAVEPELPQWLTQLDITLVVDARLRKHAESQPDLRALASLSVGIGPGYVAGYNADVVVESAWGEALGQVIYSGPASALAGESRPILGVGRERLVYAPQAGQFLSHLRIGDAVRAGERVGVLQVSQGEWLELRAPIDGVLRGLTRPGVQVPPRAKLIEVDPRGDPALCRGLGERPMRIAQGVMQAVNHLQGAAKSGASTARQHAA